MYYNRVNYTPSANINKNIPNYQIILNVFSKKSIFVESKKLTPYDTIAIRKIPCRDSDFF